MRSKEASGAGLVTPLGAPEEKRHSVTHRPRKGQSREDYTADLVNRGIFSNAAIATVYSDNIGGSDVDIAAVWNVMKRQGSATAARDNSTVESLLVAQTVSLNAIYTDLALMARSNFRKSLDVSERCLRLALKAQSQSRATAEALAFVQNPGGAVFAGQANIAHGPQQVNNRPMRQARARAYWESRPNELEQIEASNAQLDTRAPGTAGLDNSPLASMGSGDRPTKRPR